MPWKVTGKAKGCNGFAVVKEGTNTPIPGGCHPTRKEAIAHLIAVRLSYDERGVDQPRDKDGKFASKGGGGAASAAGAPGSQMKMAPKNVTSKGVNPDAEYVMSVKTGNVFKNPKYNGNPNGKGMVATNGPDYLKSGATMGKLTDQPGGAKFLATGQAKHKGAPSGTKTGKKKATKAEEAESIMKQGIAAPKLVEGPPPSLEQQAAFKKKLDKQIEAQGKVNDGVLHANINKGLGGSSDNINRLSEKQRLAIKSYTGNAYEEMNEDLRIYKGAKKTVKIKNAEEGLNRTRLAEDVVLRRRISGASKLDNLKPGDEIYDPGFVSTSTKRRLTSTGDVELRIMAPKGTKGMSVRQLSYHKDEDEVLLPPGLTLRVINVSTRKADFSSDFHSVLDVEIVKQGIRLGVDPTPVRAARPKQEEADYFSSPADSLAINGVFPDGFTLTE